jgi:DNA processing protein
MARGIDAIAHQGAATVNGRAIGVLGAGLTFATGRKTGSCTRVLERSVIISEFPLGTHPARGNFPIRNRIVAGMPLGVW